MGLVELTESAIVDTGARKWLAEQVDCPVEELEDPKTKYFWRTPQLIVNAAIGVIKRVHSRIRCEVKIPKLKIWDQVASKDLENVLQMIAVDRVQWIYHPKFKAGILNFADCISDPKTALKMIKNVDNNGKVNAFLPFSCLYEKKVRNQLLHDDAEGIGGMPLDSKGRPCYYEGGACRNCSLLSRTDMSHIASCPDAGKPDHYIQCPGCNNKKGHGIATCGEMCRAFVRRVPKEPFPDYVKYYGNNPMYARRSEPRKSRKKTEKHKPKPKKKELTKQS